MLQDGFGDCTLDSSSCECIANVTESYWWGSREIIGYALPLGPLLSALMPFQPVSTIGFQLDDFDHFCE